MEQYFLKFVKDGKRVTQTIVDESSDVLGLRSIRLGGVVFDETNIVTVSGVNSLADTITELSGASSIGDDLLLAQINSVSATSEFNDNFLLDLVYGVCGASDDNDADILAQFAAVSGDLYSEILSVSSASDDNDDDLFNLILGTSGASDDNDQLLQDQIDSITSDFAIEERFIVSGGQTVIDVTQFTFDPSGSIRDIQVFKNTSKVFQSVSGGIIDEKTGGDFVKNSDSQIEFLYPLTDGDKIIVREERTGGTGAVSGGGGGGSTDLENITVDPAPATNGSQSLGTSVKGWQCLFLKDVTNDDVYHLQVSGGVLQAILV